MKHKQVKEEVNKGVNKYINKTVNASLSKWKLVNKLGDVKININEYLNIIWWVNK